MAFLTLTGVDVRTDLEMVAGFSDKTEIAILYSANPGNRNRYPPRAWIEYAVRWIPRCALHVCGSGARTELVTKKLDDILAHVQAIQVNGMVSPVELGYICNTYPDHSIITQHPQGEGKIIEAPFENHRILVDASGGRGISPKYWERPDTKKLVGFAGGITPASLAQTIQEIEVLNNVAQGQYWIDMETGLRTTADWFDESLALEAVAVFEGRPA